MHPFAASKHLPAIKLSQSLAFSKLMLLSDVMYCDLQLFKDYWDLPFLSIRILAKRENYVLKPVQKTVFI